MSARIWLARADQPADDGWASAELGGGVGWLVAWRDDERPRPGALVADPVALDPAGEAAWISLAWLPADFVLLYDDPAVQRARQRVLEDAPAAAVTTLSRDASRIGGALTARRGPDARRLLRDDPFARIMPAQVLEIGPGLIGAPKPPASVVLERYAGKPWPASGFGG